MLKCEYEKRKCSTPYRNHVLLVFWSSSSKLFYWYGACIPTLTRSVCCAFLSFSLVSFVVSFFNALANEKLVEQRNLVGSKNVSASIENYVN